MLHEDEGWTGQRGAHTISSDRATAPAARQSAQRAYYRVNAVLPTRLTPLAPEEVENAIFALGEPDALASEVDAAEENEPLAGRLRRIEAKLDLLLSHSGIDVPPPLGAADRRRIVFSGSGLATDVDWGFAEGDFYRVDLLLPAPHRRQIRAVARVPRNPGSWTAMAAPRRLPLAIESITDDDRDALVAFSYELQRQDLRARSPRRRKDD